MMLKQQRGIDAAMCVPDDRPRKKLSFRDPEVVAAATTTTRNGGHALPSRQHHEAALPLHSALHHPPRHSLGRPHSIAGIVGLGGFSALGGVPGVANLAVPPPPPPPPPGTVSGVTSMVGNPGLLGPASAPGILAGPATPILTPPTSPTFLAAASSQLATPPVRPGPGSHQPSTPLTSKAVPAQPPTTPSPRAGPSSSSSSSSASSSASASSSSSSSQATVAMTKGVSTQPSTTTTTTTSSPVKQPVTPPAKPSANPLAARLPVSQLPAQQAKGGQPQQQQHPATPSGKSLPPSGSKGAGGHAYKPTKPASRSSSFKKQRSSPVQQAVTFLTDRGVVNGRSRSHQGDAAAAASLEDIDLESQAMRVVRTVGQAFEVCHKISVKDTPPSPEPPEDEASEHGSDVSTEKLKKDLLDPESTQEDLVTLTPSDSVNEDSVEHLLQRPNKLEPLAPPMGSDILSKGAGETYSSPLSEPLPSGDTLPMAGTPLSVHHELQLLREQLEQQQQQTQAAVSQVHLLRDQLAAETAARLEAQARTHQLLVHNKELLEHIQALVLQVRDLELKLAGSGGISGSTQLLPTPPEIKSQEPPMNPRLQGVPRPRVAQRYDECSSTPSLSSESDPKRDSSGQSSGESVTQAVAQLYSQETHRLAQVPEDAVTLGPYGPVPLGTPRNLNGPITRTASERVSRQETLAQLQRMAWARHTTK